MEKIQNKGEYVDYHKNLFVYCRTLVNFRNRPRKDIPTKCVPGMVHLQSKETWMEFKRALMNPREPFNPFYWIYRLLSTVVLDAISLLRINHLFGPWWRPLVPVFALTLVLSVYLAYFTILREVLIPRWCQQGLTSCRWMSVHDSLVHYFIFMILFHFLRAALCSPGYLSPHESASPGSTPRSGWYSKTKWTELYGIKSDEKHTKTTECKSTNKRGGIIGDKRFHPDPNSSVCKKCEIARPPRCHHCRRCGHCVLQFDHHCIWLNNCVGYGNLRSFILTVFFVTVACWYGVVLLNQPFYEPLREVLRENGGILNFSRLYFAGALGPQQKSLFDFPSVAELKTILLDRSGVYRRQVVVDIVFPFLLGVGAVLAAFLGSHIKLILRSLTSLEHRAILESQYESLMDTLFQKEDSHESKSFPENVFDQGYYRNWAQIMGSNWLYFLLPIPIQAPPPFTPWKNWNS